MNETRAIFAYEPESDPFYNMGCDIALFKVLSNRTSNVAAVLRLYSWENPAITIGFNQDINRALHFNKVEAGLPIIRRITGGRAIYHDQTEITFSLTMQMNLIPIGKKSLSEINAAISGTLGEVLKAVGIDAVWRRHSDDNFNKTGLSRSGACFASVSRYEIVSQGLKVVGGAQRRNAECFIHQGSIKVNGIAYHPALGPISAGFGGGNTDRSRVRLSDMRNAFGQYFSKQFGLTFNEGDYPSEISRDIDSEIRKLRDKPLLEK